MESKFFHCSSTQLEPGSIIRPGNWGRIIRNTGWPHNQAFKEAALEYVRQQEFSDKPSRMTSSFFFDDEFEARFYAISDGRQNAMIAYEVDLLEPMAPQHVADWRGINPSGAVDLEWARSYWLGNFLPPHNTGTGLAACREVVANTALRIVKPL
jgi:hypothetical protein